VFTNKRAIDWLLARLISIGNGWIKTLYRQIFYMSSNFGGSGNVITTPHRRTNLGLPCVGTTSMPLKARSSADIGSKSLEITQIVTNRSHRGRLSIDDVASGNDKDAPTMTSPLAGSIAWPTA
jgi:hypothetical protein